MFLSFLVPSAAPRNLLATSVTETSISIWWEEIECLDQNGPITGYTILLNGSLLATTRPSVREFTLTSLSPQTSYSVIVFGVNAQGNGPTHSISVQTVGRLGENKIIHSNKIIRDYHSAYSPEI